MLKRPKYGNRKTEFGGLSFDSAAEAERYAYLAARERAGAIQNLKMQVTYVLVPGVALNGRKKPDVRYIADFSYEIDGNTIVEDVKGVQTQIFRLKLHLMKHVHGIDVVIVSKSRRKSRTSKQSV